jgi:hypothetical protein
LEGVAFGTGSLFIGTLWAIRHNIEKLRQPPPIAVAAFERQVEEFKRKYDQEPPFLLMMTFLHPSVQFKTGQTCSDDERTEMRSMLESLVDMQLIRDTPNDQEIAGEPGSDDFHTYFTTSQSETLRPIEQITWYTEIRDTRFHSKDFWLNTPLEIQQLKKVSLRVLDSLATSASVERSFSTARVVCGEYQMAMAQEAISARMMIQANRDLAEPLVKEALEMPHYIRTEIMQQHHRKWEDTICVWISQKKKKTK